MVATVNEEGSSCSKLAANFSRLAGLCIHILHQYTAPFKTFTSMHQCSAQCICRIQVILSNKVGLCIHILHQYNAPFKHTTSAAIHHYSTSVYNQCIQFNSTRGAFCIPILQRIGVMHLIVYNSRYFEDLSRALQTKQTAPLKYKTKTKTVYLFNYNLSIEHLLIHYKVHSHTSTIAAYDHKFRSRGPF